MLFSMNGLGSVISSAETLQFDLWVNSVRITSTNLTVKCGSGTAVYVPDDNVLKLNNAYITLGSSQNNSQSGILSQMPDLKIELSGSSSIENTGGCAILATPSTAEYTPYNLYISGSGDLTITDTSANGGIQCSGKLEISGTSLNVSSSGNAIISNSDVTIKNSKVTASAGGSSNAITSQSGKVTITDSTVSAAAASGSGIYLGSNTSGAVLSMKDSSLSASAAYGIRGANPDKCSISIENCTALINTPTSAVTIPEKSITLKNCYVSTGSFSGGMCEISNKPLAIGVIGGKAYITEKYGTYITEAMPGNSITVVPDVVNGEYTKEWTCDGLKFENNGVIADFVMPAHDVTLKPERAEQTSYKIVLDQKRNVVGKDVFLSLVNMYGVPATDTTSLVHIDLDGDGTDDLYGYRSDYSFQLTETNSVTSAVFNANRPTLGKYTPITIQMVSHIHDMEYIAAIAATCTEFGSKEYYQCKDCHNKYLDEDGKIAATEDDLIVPIKNHSWDGQIVYENRTEPACETDGSADAVKYCQYCHAQMSKESVVLDKKGHSWSDWVTVKEATETAEGEERRTCFNDPTHTESRKIPMLSHVHKPKYVSPVKATCTEEGYEGYYRCSGCLRIFTDEACTDEVSDLSYLKVPKADHEWDGKIISENRIEPTCESDGSEEQIKCCRNCGVQISREYVILERTEHRWGEWTTVIEATESSDGLERHNCLDDPSHFETRTIPALEHSHDMIYYPQVDADCTHDGNKEYYQCRECKRMYFDKFGMIPVNSSQDILIFAKWHTPDSPVIENKVEATSTSDGSYDEVVYCTVCELELKRNTVVIPKLGSGGDDDNKDDVIKIKLGDADLSGTIDIKDAVMIIQHINGVKPLTGYAYLAANVNMDASISIEDAALVINHINGVKPLSSFDPPKK